MSLDEDKLVASVDSVVKKTSKGEDIYSHNLRLEFRTYDDMRTAKFCLIRHYNNRFKIRTEIQPPSDVDPVKSPEEFNSRTKYYILMEAF